MDEEKNENYLEEENEDELELEEDADENLDVNSFKGTSVVNMDLSVDIVDSYFREGRLNLNPSFQRRNVWSSVKQQSKFIESLILRLPIPSMLFAENNDIDSYIVIDGKQRLTTIIDFLASDKNGEGFKLKGLEILKDLNGYNYKRLKEDKSKIRYLSQLRTQPLKVSIVRNYNERLLYFIFARLNSGSVALSTQELRHTLFPGNYSDFINMNGCENNHIRAILKLKKGKVDPRMRDSELLCRYYAFKYFRDKYNETMGELFDLTYEIINKQWEEYSEKVVKDLEEFNRSCETIHKIFGKDAFKLYSVTKKEYLKFNRLIFDIMTVLFSEEENRKKVEGRESEFVVFFKKLFDDKDYDEAFKPTTSTKEKTNRRFKVFFEKFAEKF